MLGFSREDILEYATENNLKWREDSSNSKTDYLRNKLRIEVLPQFKKGNDSVLKNFQKTQQNLQSSQSLIEDYMALVYNLSVSESENGYKINIKKLRELPHTDALLYELLSGFGFTSWDDISQLLDAQTGKQVFSKTHRLIKNREFLLLTEIASEEGESEILISENETKISHPINLKFETSKYIGETEKNIIYVDSQKLKFPLKLRKWEEGDSFQTLRDERKEEIEQIFQR